MFLLPSFHEGMPYSAIEAQANGLVSIINSELSKEISLTDLAIRMPIDTPEQWANAIKSTEGAKKRGVYSVEVASLGYDIQATCEKFYAKLGF